MRLRHIEVFRALMLTHSVTRAAAMLHTSQPTASRFLAELEREIGFQLFSRARGKLTPTPEAEALFAEVQRSFAGLERIADVAHGIASFRYDRLRISSISAFSLGILVKTAPRFHARFPHVKLRLEVGSFGEVVRDAATGQCELAFVAYPVDAAGLMQLPLLSTPAVCILPAVHPLAAREVIDVRDLEGAEFISIGRDARSGIQVDRIFAEAGIGRTIVLETQTAAVACAFVKEGLGLSIIDPLTAATQADERLIVRPFTPRFDFSFSALVRSDRPLPRIAKLFLEEVRDASTLARGTGGFATDGSSGGRGRFAVSAGGT